MTNALAPVADLAPGIYVMDRFAQSARKAVVAGPFEDIDPAAQDRAERNIADDCSLYRFDGFRFELIPEAAALPHYGTAYHAPTDMYVDVHASDSKSRTTITHPLHGVCVVPASELTEFVTGTLRAN